MEVGYVVWDGYRCRYMYSAGDGVPVIFLHGYSFTSRVWIEIGIPQSLSERNIPFLLVDMPYGRASDCTGKTRAVKTNLMVIDNARGLLGLTREPLLVGASLGGYIALYYGLQYGVSGLLLIAPVGTDDERIVEHYRGRRVPILIVYGEKDRVVELDDLVRFRDRLGYGDIYVYEDARHPAYLDSPDRFREDLLKFYDIVSQRSH